MVLVRDALAALCAGCVAGLRDDDIALSILAGNLPTHGMLTVAHDSESGREPKKFAAAMHSGGARCAREQLRNQTPYPTEVWRARAKPGSYGPRAAGQEAGVHRTAYEDRSELARDPLPGLGRGGRVLRAVTHRQRALCEV
jgi:hypothetical protein